MAFFNLIFVKPQAFFSPGKLLLTSEYFVLDGALALAVPTILGQEMTVTDLQDDDSLIIWEANHENIGWLNVTIDYKNWTVKKSNIVDSAEFILKVFKEIFNLSPLKFTGCNSYQFKTNLQFPGNFGLGSSSTLMVNLAQWAHVNATVLNENCLGGSGYDIAVAEKHSALLFQKKLEQNYVEKVIFKPSFLEDLILVHLNQKQNSREGIQLYRSKNKSQILVDTFSSLTNEILHCKELDVFSELMEKHESLVSEFLDLQTVKNKFFPDCPMFVKSLGAWGGDFVLSRKFPDYKKYFADRNYNAVFNWKDLVETH